MSYSSSTTGTDKPKEHINPKPLVDPEVSVLMPQIGDLAERLHFSPDNGRIWLDNRRMLLIDSYSMGSLRIELIEALGTKTARGLLTRMGYTCGTRDGQLAMKVRGNSKDPMERFLAGPQLHALEGIVVVEPVKMEIDVTKGKFYGEFIWRDSSEGEVHINNYGIGSEPVCWMQIGYASGYCSMFMGRPIMFREVQCSGLGHETCRIIGKPVSEWENPENDLVFFKPQPFVNKKVKDMEPIVTQKKSYPLTPAARKPDEYTPDSDATPVEEEEAPSPYTEMVGVSARFSAACHMLSRVAPTDATVLFLGETGVGKEMFARALHRISNRVDAPFVAVNCAAIPDNLIEAELFGVEKGAYTGAVTSRAGRFELAHNGTLFLDEAGTLSLSAQGKLLRVLQEREIERVGSTTTKRINVRVVAATNIDLHKEVKAGNFREDLFFRLNVFPIRIPPLRERRDDIPLLMDTFLKRFIINHKKEVTGFTAKAVEALLSYDWPGNIRELENVVERGIIMASENDPIDLCDLFTYGERMTSSVFRLDQEGSLKQKTDDQAEEHNAEDYPLEDMASAFFDRDLSLDQMEDVLIDKAMGTANGNVSTAAKLLGITRARLDYRLKKRK